MKIFPLIAGERAWAAADRACGADAYPLVRKWGDPEATRAASRAHFAKISQPGEDWAEIDEEAYMDALECMPPHYIQGGFCVYEAVCEGPHGTLFLTCVRNGGRYFAAYRVPSQNCALDFLRELSEVKP